MAFGFCASNNLDAVLLKLEQITKTEMVPKSSGFLGLMKVILFLCKITCINYNACSNWLKSVFASMHPNMETETKDNCIINNRDFLKLLKANTSL
jgi:hypothetical protein